MPQSVIFVSLLWCESCIAFKNANSGFTELVFVSSSSSFIKDVEANTVRLKEHEQAVLVLEKSPRASTLGSIK